jgi:hypothetical protein
VILPDGLGASTGASVTTGASVAACVLSGAGGSVVGVAAGAQAESITVIRTVIPMNLNIFWPNIFFLLMYYERIEGSVHLK